MQEFFSIIRKRFARAYSQVQIDGICHLAKLEYSELPGRTEREKAQAFITAKIGFDTVPMRREFYRLPGQRTLEHFAAVAQLEAAAKRKARYICGLD